MSTLAPPVNVESVLTPPASASRMDQALSAVQGQGAMGLGQISAVIGMLVGFDPLQEWVYKPFIGDWRSMEAAAEAWPRCGQAVQLINERVSQLGSFVNDEWDGKAAYKFGECHEKLGQLLEGLPQQCEQAGVMDEQLAIFAQGIVKFIGEVIQSLVQFGLDILSLIWVPVVGEINVGKVLAIAIPMIIGWTIEITNLFNEFLGFIDAVHAIHSGIVGMLGPVRQSLSMLTAAASIGLQIYNVVSAASSSGSSGSAPQG